MLKDLLTDCPVLPHGETPQSIAVKTHGHNLPGALLSQFRDHSPLDNPEKGLGITMRALDANPGPLSCQPDRVPHIVMVRRIRGAFVKGHDHIRSQSFLDRHGLTRADEVGGTVHMGLECDPLFRDLSQLGKTVDLIPAAVREDRSFPAHKAVKPPSRSISP